MAKITTKFSDITYELELSSSELAEIVLLLGKVATSDINPNRGSYDLYNTLLDEYEQREGHVPKNRYTVLSGDRPVYAVNIRKERL